MYCISCGASYPKEAAFCATCGKKVSSYASSDMVSLPSSSDMKGETSIASSPPAAWHHVISTSAKWIRRVGIPLATLAWIGLVAVLLWVASHVARSLILLAIAAILAYALAPLVNRLQRLLPHLLAILLVYLIVMGGIGVVLFFFVRAALAEVEDLKNQMSGLFQPGHVSPLRPLLSWLGIDATQLQNTRQIITSHLGGLVNDVVPVVSGIFNIVVDMVVIAILSIYLMLDGSRVFGWLRANLPKAERRRGFFLLDMLETVVGGYIRGQLMLSLLIGILVGAGMAILQVPHPILLGELAFLLAFIPVLGTFLSGTFCVLLSLTTSTSWVVGLTHQTWILALIVLLYFVAMHFIESHIVGPRVVGHAIGLHPVVFIAALVAAAELFGILGALFAAPVVGVMQAIIIWLWREWRVAHANQFS